MMYQSTRDTSCKVSAAQAITLGISKDGGLFVPESLPALTPERLERLAGMSYIDCAADILADFLTDFSRAEIMGCVEAAYGGGKFGDGGPIPLAKLGSGRFMLELWHGPTCAFKDMALQLLPHLLKISAGKTVGTKRIAILTATSGDTGKAALEGFKDVDGTQILVFYPKDGVSEIQRLQMVSQEGGNVGVCAVTGNFDDTQSGVKDIFADKVLAAELEQKEIILSSANSINWGRLVPQICYYIGAYCELARTGEITLGDTVNVCVPTGNFGNILAAYYAKKMGLPLGRLICASNINNVLTDFIRTGVYDRRREFAQTSSPSMDILISSNLERLLFALYGEDGNAVKELMRQLSEDGVYTVTDEVREKLQSEFYGGYCDEDKTAKTVKDTFDTFSYLCDTHTAVAVAVADEYAEKTGDDNKTLVVSTANPYKFAASILQAVTGENRADSEFRQAELLADATGTEIPQSILALKEKAERFSYFCETSQMRDYVREQLGV